MSCEDVTSEEDNVAAKARIKWIVDSVKELDAKRSLASYEVEKEEMKTAESGNVSIHNVELLDVDSLDLEDEDSWLYKTSGAEAACSTMSPYAWMREEFDRTNCPSTPKSLLKILDSTGRNGRRSLDLASMSTPLKIPSDTDAVASFRPSRVDSSAQSFVSSASLLSRLAPSFDSRTFTRPKRNNSTLTTPSDGRATNSSPISNNSVLADEGLKYANLKAHGRKSVSPSNGVERHRIESKSEEMDDRDGGSPPVRCNGGATTQSDGASSARSVNGSCSGGESTEDLGGGGATTYRLAGVEDVQVLARLQEESLRRDFNDPLGTSQKAFSRGLHYSTGRLLDSVESTTLTSTTSPSKSLGYTSTNSLNSGLSSGSSSPAESLTNVTHPLGNKSHGRIDTRQRSMPNLSRSSNLSLPPGATGSTPGAPQHQSTHKQSPAGGAVSGLRMPSVRRSPVCIADPDAANFSEGRHASPNRVGGRSGIPCPSSSRGGMSGIPRLGSSLAKPSRSTVTGQASPMDGGTRQSLSAAPRRNDSSWREGCF